jgi:hypothetical protein
MPERAANSASSLTADAGVGEIMVRVNPDALILRVSVRGPSPACHGCVTAL